MRTTVIAAAAALMVMSVDANAASSTITLSDFDLKFTNLGTGSGPGYTLGEAAGYAGRAAAPFGTEEVPLTGYQAGSGAKFAATYSGSEGTASLAFEDGVGASLSASGDTANLVPRLFVIYDAEMYRSFTLAPGGMLTLTAKGSIHETASTADSRTDAYYFLEFAPDDPDAAFDRNTSSGFSDPVSQTFTASVSIANTTDHAFSGTLYAGVGSDLSVSAVPEPANVAMLLAGLGFMGVVVKRRKS